MLIKFVVFNIVWLVWYVICLLLLVYDVVLFMIIFDWMWFDFGVFFNWLINIFWMVGCLEIGVVWFLNNFEIRFCLFGVKFVLNIFWLIFFMREWIILGVFLNFC